MAKRDALKGKPYAGNSRVRFDDVEDILAAIYKYKCAIVVTMTCFASMLSFATTTVTYDGTDSLADGEITFAHDESGKIIEMRMRSDANETLILNGKELSFADGAHIILGQNTNVIQNVFNPSGTLFFGCTNRTSGAWGAAYTTVFTNLRLDDISPISAVGGLYMTGVSLAPYYVVRDGDTMRVEMQGLHGSAVKGVHLELKQVGNDIQGRILAGRHFGTSATYREYKKYLGFSMFETNTITHVSNWYGINSLTVGPRRETYDYVGNLLSDQYDTTVATNTSLEDIEILYGINGHNKQVGQGIAKERALCVPHHVSLANGVLSAQLFNTNCAGYTMCVKVELRQSGANIVARAIYSKYVEGQGGNYDFDMIESSYNLQTEETSHEYANGIDMLALRRKNRDRLVIPVSGTLSIAKPVGGHGVSMMFESAGAGTVVDANSANSMTDCAYVIKGDETKGIVFRSRNKDALPSGETEAYGNAELQLNTGGGYNYGTSKGKSAIKMHSGSRLYPNTGNVLYRVAQTVTLDAATLQTHNTAVTYLNWLTLSNGASVAASSNGNGSFCAGATNGGAPAWSVAGSGVSTFDANLVILNTTEIDVMDTVPGHEPDFVFNGSIANYKQNAASFVKSGDGMMLMNGMVSCTNTSIRVVGGTLAVGGSGILHEKCAFSLEGGVLELSSGTANVCASITVSENSTLMFGAGATLSVDALTMGENVECLSIESVNKKGPFKVAGALDAVTLAKIRLNGERVVQAEDGRIVVHRGLVICIH